MLSVSTRVPPLPQVLRVQMFERILGTFRKSDRAHSGHSKRYEQVRRRLLWAGQWDLMLKDIMVHTKGSWTYAGGQECLEGEAGVVLGHARGPYCGHSTEPGFRTWGDRVETLRS